jgi:hypothetical protein
VTTSSAETQQWNPLPAIGKFLAKVVVRKVVSAVAGVLLLPIVISAARATNGRIHLVLGLLVVSIFMAIAQSVGALLVVRGERAIAPLALTAKYWLFLPIFALWPLLSLAGISDDNKWSMVLGVLIGIMFAIAVWTGWGLIGRRHPSLKYQPGRLKGWRWYLRLSMNFAGLIGGLAGIGVMNI